MKEPLVLLRLCAAPADFLTFETELQIADMLHFGVCIVVLGGAEGELMLKTEPVVCGIAVLVEQVVGRKLSAGTFSITRHAREVG